MAIRDLTVCAAQHRQRDKERLSSEISIYSQKLIYKRLHRCSFNLRQGEDDFTQIEQFNKCETRKRIKSPENQTWPWHNAQRFPLLQEKIN